MDEKHRDLRRNKQVTGERVPLTKHLHMHALCAYMHAYRHVLPCKCRFRLLLSTPLARCSVLPHAHAAASSEWPAGAFTGISAGLAAVCRRVGCPSISNCVHILSCAWYILVQPMDWQPGIRRRMTMLVHTSVCFVRIVRCLHLTASQWSWPCQGTAWVLFRNA